jgi:hypothetical protein
MTRFRLRFTAAVLAASLASATLGIAACTQGTTPDCGDSACGAGAVLLPEGSVVVEASVSDDAG